MSLCDIFVMPTLEEVQFKDIVGTEIDCSNSIKLVQGLAGYSEKGYAVVARKNIKVT